MSFVRWRHIIFQYIQTNCYFTLRMKLPRFLLNYLWLCMTSIEAVKLWPVFWPSTMHKRASRHWRHSSMTSFFIVVNFTYKMAYSCLLVVGFGEFYPLNADPKRHFLVWLHVIWVIVRKNPPKQHFIRRVREKIKIKQILVLYFTYLPRRTLTTDWQKCWVARSSRRRNQLFEVLS